MESYCELAGVYDRLMSHVDFSKVTDYYLRAAKRFDWQGQRILDLACGTGTITLELMKRGFAVTGVDQSQEMLAMADEKIYAAGFQPDLINQNMMKLNLSEQYELVISAFDSLNYLLSERELEKTFSRVQQSLAPGGLFLFDLHSEHKLKVVFGDQTFTYSGDDYAYIWRNRYQVDRGVSHMMLDIFIPNAEGMYQRVQEYHRERYYSIDTITALCKKTGLKVLAVYGDQKFRKPGPNTERIYFVVKRR